MTNKFLGWCERCGGPVPSGEGVVALDNGRWLVTHTTHAERLVDETEAAAR